jgi:hypothetical protein
VGISFAPWLAVTRDEVRATSLSRTRRSKAATGIRYNVPTLHPGHLNRVRMALPPTVPYLIAHTACLARAAAVGTGNTHARTEPPRALFLRQTFVSIGSQSPGKDSEGAGSMPQIPLENQGTHCEPCGAPYACSCRSQGPVATRAWRNSHPVACRTGA